MRLKVFTASEHQNHCVVIFMAQGFTDPIMEQHSKSVNSRVDSVSEQIDHPIVEGTGRTLFTVIDQSDSGWVGRNKNRDSKSVDTLKSVKYVLNLLGRGRF